MAVEYKTLTYPTAKVYLAAGWYQKKEVEEVLHWFKKMEHANKMSMKQQTDAQLKKGKQ